MLQIEGYKAFRGRMRITPKNDKEPFEMSGDWIYEPKYDCWYCNGRSFHRDICEVITDDTEQRWVSVFDKLPEDIYGSDRQRIEVIVQTSVGDVGTASRILKDGQYKWCNRIKNPIMLWMPMPEPLRAGE